MIRWIVVPVLFAMLSCCHLSAWASEPPSEAELNAITERGRMLAQYDEAAWHASDAVLAMKPQEGSIAFYVARKLGDSWTVYFGRFNDARDKFLIVYEVTESLSAKPAKVTENIPPREDDGFLLFAAKARETARQDFKGEPRPYNIAMLPTSSQQMYVYVVPAQTETDTYPLGGDVRYLVSSDGERIIEKRQMHKTVLEVRAPSGTKLSGGTHTHFLSEIPEDTDVFHVLARKPNVPEYVVTRTFMYIVQMDGKITYRGETETLLNIWRKEKDSKK